MNPATMVIGLGHYLTVSTILFTIGAAGFLYRRNALVALMSIELMLNAVNLTLVAANRWQPLAQSPEGTSVTAAPIGHVFAFFTIAVAAAEAAVGLAIVLSFYRLRKTVRTDAGDMLRG
jgi:NADH-quinone oxidoreductase subunit K